MEEEDEEGEEEVLSAIFDPRPIPPPPNYPHPDDDSRPIPPPPKDPHPDNVLPIPPPPDYPHPDDPGAPSAPPYAVLLEILRNESRQSAAAQSPAAGTHSSNPPSNPLHPQASSQISHSLTSTHHQPSTQEAPQNPHLLSTHSQNGTSHPAQIKNTEHRYQNQSLTQEETLEQEQAVEQQRRMMLDEQARQHHNERQSPRQRNGNE